MDHAEWEPVFAHAGRLPLDYYGEVFNPLPVPAEEPVVASLSDDIADIYRDGVTGPRLFRSGRRDCAVWERTFAPSSHRGDHITGAIRALHCRLAANEPSRPSAEQ